MSKKYNGKRVLITGGLGFIGSNLAIRLVHDGATVTLADCRLSGHGANDFNISGVKDQVSVMQSDIRDASAMERAVSGQDVIFNIAGQTSHVDSMVDPFLDNDINTRGHLVLLEACRNVNPEVRIVYCGTRAQYGSPSYTPVDESCPMRPIDIYGADKLTAELYHFLYARICGLQAVSLRASNTYGPRHQMKHAKYGVQNYLLRLALDGQEISVFGDGTQLRDLNYIDDVIEAFVLAGLSDVAVGQAYNLGGTEPIQFIDLVKALIDAAGSGSFKFIPFPPDRAKIETGDFTADISKITRDLGWKPQVALAEGLAKTVEFYCEHKQHYWQ